MKRPRTRVAEAIALRGIHAEMEWIRDLGKSSSEYDRKFARWVTNKEVNRPRIYLIK